LALCASLAVVAFPVMAFPVVAWSVEVPHPRVRPVLNTIDGPGAGAWTPDSGHIVTLSHDGFITVWDAGTGQVVDRFGQSSCQLRVDASGRVVPRPGLSNCITPRIEPAPDDADNFLRAESLNVSPDGRFLVMVGTAFYDMEAEVFDLAGREVAGWLHRRPVAWVAGDRGARLIVEPAEGCAPGACPRSIIDLATLGSANPSETPAAGEPLGPGIALVGPYESVSPDGRLRLGKNGWVEPARIRGDGSDVAFQAYGANPALDPVFSPDGRRFAMRSYREDLHGDVDAATGAWVFDMEGGRLFKVYPFRPSSADPHPAAVRSVDGWISNDRLAVTDASGRKLAVDISARSAQPLAGPPHLVSPYDEAPASHPACRPGPASAQHQIVWSGCYTLTKWVGQTLVFSSARDGAALFRLTVRQDGTWLALDPSNRYDTNADAKTSLFTWAVVDPPVRFLPAPTFSREYYQPGLMAKLLDCSANRDCVSPFKPVRDISSLNLALPTVRIAGVRPGRQPNTVSVDVQAIEGDDLTAPPRRSGLYDLRLFRDGKLVAQIPPPKLRAAGGAGELALADWQADTAVPEQKDGLYTFENVAMPASVRVQEGELSAYAFNRDRVKGEDAAYAYRFLNAHPVARRAAYVIAIGADDYRFLPDHALRFAVNDAEAIASNLSTFIAATRDEDGRPLAQAYDVIPITLVSNWTTDQASKAAIHAVFDILAGKVDDAGRRALAEAGADATGLARATPDDLVLVAFAGHGWANAFGDFYLLPSDARQPDAKDPASLATLISSAELADWLRGVDAGEMALIIDACHSAASVAAEGFKPGPMGDAGLGQLAYDKGIRILAATQADDVARESDTLGGGHGLLTYVLVDKALSDPTAGGAERQVGGNVRLDALLNYVVDRMPAESAQLLDAPPPWLAAAGWKPMLSPRDPPSPEPPHRQQPALFDFTGRPSSAAVKPPAKVGS